MGLGKTMQAVAFTDIFLRYTSSRFVLCVVPVNTLQNWMSEFDQWLPPAEQVSVGSAHPPVLGRSFQVFMMAESAKNMETRLKVGVCVCMHVVVCAYVRAYVYACVYVVAHFVQCYMNLVLCTLTPQIIKEWRDSGGVLLIGYEMYRLLSLSVPSLGGNKMATKRKKTAAQLAAAMEATIDLDHNEKEMESLMGGCGQFMGGCGQSRSWVGMVRW